MIAIVNQFDIGATQFINELIPHTSFFNLFFSFFSLRGNSVFIWLAIVVLLLLFEEIKHRHRFVILFLISFLCTAFVTNIVVKNIVQRPRPAFVKTSAGRPSNCPTDFSFPSGHASTAFAAATVIAFFDKKRRWMYYSVATLIGLSRIYLGCHYFLDVFVGSIFGCIISKLLLTYKFPRYFFAK